MRVIFFAAVIATAFGADYTYTGDYLKLEWHGTAVVANTDTDSQTTCSPAVVSVNLLRVPSTDYLAADATVKDLVGACMNIGAHGTVFARNQGTAFDAVNTHSFFISKITATPGLYEPWVSATINCGGAALAINNGAGANFGFEGLTDSGDSDCGGVVAVAADSDNGIAFISAATGVGHGITATLFQQRKFIAADLVGPFSAATCTNLTGGAGKSGIVPLVIPLDSTTADVAAKSEFALATDKYQCTSLSAVATVGSQFLYKVSVASVTSGELMIQYSHGTGTVWADRNTCTMSTTAGNNYKLTFTVGIRGDVGYCKQAYQTDGTTGQSKYWRLIPHIGSIGAFPTMPALPTSAPGAACASPASGLHLSAFMAGFIAIIAMMM